MHDPRAIANEFIKIGVDNERPLTLMQILKLSYIAHGFCLAFLKRPLSNQEPEAWKYGPVFPSIYQSLKFCGTNPIKEPIKTIQLGSANLFALIEEKFSQEEGQIISFVYESYCNLDGWQLSDLTHKEGTPWDKAWKANRGARGAKIPNREIKNHFEQLFAA